MDREHIKIGQLEVVFLAAKGDTDGHADVFELRVPPFVNRSDGMARALVVGTPATLGPELA